MSGKSSASKRVLLAVVSIASLITMAFGSPARSLQQDEDGDPIIEKYRAMIPRLMAEQDVPGLAIAVVDDQGVIWAEGFGFTDNDHKIPVTPDTLFNIQSTSKLFTATAVMMAVQDGLLDLDAPITTYLPDFTVHSIFEEHPERKITLRMLLSHTAGFTHEAPVGNNYDLGPVVFQDHVKTIPDTWLRFPVGTGYAYSNVGISLAGYILQKVYGQSFPDAVETHLLRPLGMNDSSFDINKVRRNPNRAVGHTAPFPSVPLEIPLIPEGGLYTSASDMAKFIQFQLNQGSVDGKSVLSPALLDEQDTVPAPAQGSVEGYALGVARTEWNKNHRAMLFSHGGGGFGFITDLWWLPELKIGITVLTNSVEHHLQGDLALQVLDDFVQDPRRPYYGRMLALPDRPFVSEGDGHYRPPAGMLQLVEAHEMPVSEADRLRWKGYEGLYGVRYWGALYPSLLSAQVYRQGDHLYLETTGVAGDGPTPKMLFEVSPGLFFATNGEALDFRGPIPTWRNIKLERTGTGPAPWQQAILVFCGLVFLSGLLYFPVRSLVRRIRKSVPPGPPAGHWTRLIPVLVILSSLFGLLSLALIAASPTIIYSGFLGWLELPLWQRLFTHAPFALLVCGNACLILMVPAWRNQWWPGGERAYFTAVSLASLVLLLFLAGWHLIGLSLG
jgi:CubicO group peptidase (beta-lactamase class C family)